MGCYVNIFAQVIAQIQDQYRQLHDESYQEILSEFLDVKKHYNIYIHILSHVSKS